MGVGLAARAVRRRETAIGGALTDLGCHPVYLTQLFLGPAAGSVAAIYTSTTGRGVEDNAVVTIAYPNGAIGVTEASFVTTPGAGPSRCAAPQAA